MIPERYSDVIDGSELGPLGLEAQTPVHPSPAPKLSLPSVGNPFADHLETQLGDMLRPVEKLQAKIDYQKAQERQRLNSANAARAEQIAIDIQQTQDSLSASDARFSDMWERLSAMRIPAATMADPTTGESLAGLVYGLFGGQYAEGANIVKGLSEVRGAAEREAEMANMQMLRQNLLMQAENEMETRRFLRQNLAGLQAEQRGDARRAEERGWQIADQEKAFQNQQVLLDKGFDQDMLRLGAQQRAGLEERQIQHEYNKEMASIEAEINKDTRNDATQKQVGLAFLDLISRSTDVSMVESGLTTLRGLGIALPAGAEDTLRKVVQSNKEQLETQGLINELRYRNQGTRGSGGLSGSLSDGFDVGNSPFDPIANGRISGAVPQEFAGVQGLDPSAKGPADPPTVVARLGQYMGRLVEPDLPSTFVTLRSGVNSARFDVASANLSIQGAQKEVKEARSPQERSQAENKLAKARLELKERQSVLNEKLNRLSREEKGIAGYTQWAEDLKSKSLLMIKYIGLLGLPKEVAEARREEIRNAYRERTGRNDIK